MKKPHFKVSDGLTNIYSNIGTSSDVRSYNQFEYSAFLGFEQLDKAYRESPLARKVVDITADDATREWRTFTCDDAQELTQAEQEICLPIFYNELIKLARLSGGAMMLMITDQDLSKPLKVKALKQGSLKRLLNFDRFELTPSTENVTNVLSENYLLPEYYMVNNGSQLIHHTHFIRLNGEWLPRRLNKLERGWGDSVLRKVMCDLKDAVMARSGAAALINKANIDVFKMNGFYEAIASGQDDAIIQAVTAYKMGLSNTNVAVTDSNSEFVRHSLSMGGLPDMVAELRTWLAAAAGIPATRFFGTQAAGLGNSQEGDIKQYYSNIAAQQNAYYSKPLDQLDQVLAMSTLGFIPDDMMWDWDPLFQATGQEQAQEDLYNAQADAARIEQGVPPSAILKKLQVENKYALTDEHIAAMEKMEQEQMNNDIDEQIQFAVREYAEREKEEEINSSASSEQEGDNMV